MTARNDCVLSLNRRLLTVEFDENCMREEKNSHSSSNESFINVKLSFTLKTTRFFVDLTFTFNLFSRSDLFFKMKVNYQFPIEFGCQKLNRNVS